MHTHHYDPDIQRAGRNRGRAGRESLQRAACTVQSIRTMYHPPSPFPRAHRRKKSSHHTPPPPKPRAAHQPILVTPQKPAIAWQRMTDDASARIPSRASPSPTPLLTPHYSGVVCNIIAQTAYAETHITHPTSPSSGLQRDGVAVSE